MTRENRFKFLLEVKEVLDKAGITFWIDWGTLLGFYREGDFIEFDPDIDLGAKREEQDKIKGVINKLEDIGRVITRVEVGDAGVHYLSGYKIFRDGMWIDIAFYWNCNGKWIIPISEWPKVMVFKEEFFNNLTNMNIKGVSFRVPEKTEEYLIAHYGKDWRIPDEKQTLHVMPNVVSIEPYKKCLI